MCFLNVPEYVSLIPPHPLSLFTFPLIRLANEKDETLKQVCAVAGNAYRELMDWINQQDNNLTTLVMRKLRDNEGTVDWISPKNSISWVSVLSCVC